MKENGTAQLYKRLQSDIISTSANAVSNLYR